MTPAAGWVLMRWLLRLVLMVGVVAGGPRVTRAAEPVVEPVIDVVIDVADLPANRSELGVAVEAELARFLAQRQESLPAGVILAGDRRLFIELRPGPIPGADDLLIHVAVLFENEVIAESATETCLACSDERVAEKALGLLEPLLPELPAPVPVEPPAPAVVEPASEPVDIQLRRAQPDRRLLIPGAVLLGTGGVGVGVGIGLIVANERVASPPDALDLEVIKYREAGIATTVIGGVVAVTGATLLGLAHDQRRHSRVATTPVFGPGRWGVSLTGGF